MNGKISPETSALSTTMLIPLWAKAVEQERPEDERLLTDAEAPRMLAQIDYDFSKFNNIVMSQVGCCGRAHIFDEEARRFIAAHPDAVVVQLGAGLDARYERLGRPAVTAWYDLDLPEVIALRRQLLPESGNHYLGSSMLDESWMQTAAAHGKPVLLLCEGVLMYFDAATVKDYLATLARHLPQAMFVFDIVPPFLVGKAKKHDALGKMGEDVPEFQWSLKDNRELEQWLPGLKLEAESELSRYCGKRYYRIARLVYATKWGRRHMDQHIVRVRLP